MPNHIRLPNKKKLIMCLTSFLNFPWLL